MLGGVGLAPWPGVASPILPPTLEPEPCARVPAPGCSPSPPRSSSLRRPVARPAPPCSHPPAPCRLPIPAARSPATSDRRPAADPRFLNKPSRVRARAKFRVRGATELLKRFLFFPPPLSFFQLVLLLGSNHQNLNWHRRFMLRVVCTLSPVARRAPSRCSASRASGPSSPAAAPASAPPTPPAGSPPAAGIAPPLTR